MRCEQARERIAEGWAGALGEEAREELAAHLTACEECRSEAAGLETIWTALGKLPEEEPSAASYQRFQEMLSAYRLGMRHGSGRRASVMGWLAGLWPKQMFAQLAVASAALVVGLGVGHWFTTNAHDRERIAQLGTEVRGMRQLVALSLMQQQSASERLQGITWSVRTESPDEQVLSALLTTLNTDPNVNVRLAAVDALQRFSADMRVRRGLRQALPRQTSPLVQIALIDWIADSGDRHAAEPLHALKQQADLNPAVEARLTQALGRFR